MAESRDDRNEAPAIKVNDKRRNREEPAPAPKPAEAPAAAPTAAEGHHTHDHSGDHAGHDHAGHEHLGAPPPIDFTTFLLSLASTAVIQMGAAPDPETGQVSANPHLAHETIDLLGMLREKTRGNLTPEEQQFFDALLYDLRVRFVESTRAG